MGEAAVAEGVGVGDAEPEADDVEVGQQRVGDRQGQEGRGHGVGAQGEAERQGHGGMGDERGHVGVPPGLMAFLVEGGKAG